MPIIDVESLEQICAEVMTGAGVALAEARRISHSLVLANLMGHDSHGVIRLPQYVQALEDGIVKAGRDIRVTREADASAVVDGQWGFGQTVCAQAMELALKKARERSVAAVELFNSSHIGRLGEYVEQAAESGTHRYCYVQQPRRRPAAFAIRRHRRPDVTESRCRRRSDGRRFSDRRGYDDQRGC